MSREPDIIVFGAPVVDEDDVAAVVETLRSGWLGPGPQVEALSEEFAAAVEARDAVAVSSGTAALHLALLTLDLEPGDEVITSPITFPATANAIVHARGTPVFADVGPDGTIDPSAVVAAIGPRTRAVLPVHHAGLPCDLDALGALAERHGLAILQDAAHAIEARWRGRGMGAIAPAAYSLYATKNVSTGEGGIFSSPDLEQLARAARLSQHGVTRTAWSRFEGGNLGGYDVTEPGFNYALTDIQAALGRSQLRKVPARHRRRAEIAAQYDDLLAGGPVELPTPGPPHAVHARHLYPVLAADRPMRDHLRGRLLEAGIGTGVHFEPVHLTTWYRERYGYLAGMLPAAEDLGSRTLSLPLSPGLSEDDVDRVAKALLSS